MIVAAPFTVKYYFSIFGQFIGVLNYCNYW